MAASLARLWRPQSFQELVGQPIVVQTLRQAVIQNEVPQAMLFVGPRGSGKTSTARILAKILQCPNRDAEGNPCQTCENCQAIQSGQHLDVVEIDGASHTGVDSIRQLKENLLYKPVLGSYKVYIIDEVHMLSQSAFNALLKTLEEPPSHVVFILATTEFHKVPATVVSRCQRFFFQKIPPKLIQERLQQICIKQGWLHETEALWLIARQSDGSLRDALTLMEQLSFLTQGQLKVETIEQALGVDVSRMGWNLFQSLVTGQRDSYFKWVEKFWENPLNPVTVAEHLLRYWRWGFLFKKGFGAKLMEQGLVSQEEATFLSQVGEFLPDDLVWHVMFSAIWQGLQDLQNLEELAFAADMVLLRLWFIREMPQIFQPSIPGAGSGLKPDSSANCGSKNIQQTGFEKWGGFIEKMRLRDPALAAKLEVVPILVQAGQIQVCWTQAPQWVQSALRLEAVRSQVTALWQKWVEDDPMELSWHGESSREALSLSQWRQQQEVLSAQQEMAQIVTDPYLNAIGQSLSARIKHLGKSLPDS